MSLIAARGLQRSQMLNQNMLEGSRDPTCDLSTLSDSLPPGLTMLFVSWTDVSGGNEPLQLA